MVTVDDLKEMFVKVFGSELNIDDLCEASDLRKDVGMNSISLLYMAMSIEEKYGVQFNNSDFEKISTVGDVIAVIKEKV